MGVKKDFMEACKTGDSNTILELLQNNPNEQLLSDLNYKRIIYSCEFDLIKKLTEEYNMVTDAIVIKTAFQRGDHKICDYFLGRDFKYSEKDSWAIRSAIGKASRDVKFVDLIGALIDLYYKNGNELESGFISYMSADANDEMMKVYRDKIPNFEKKQKEYDNKHTININNSMNSIVNDFYAEEKKREEASKLPWEEHDDSIPLIAAIENNEITDKVIISLLDAGAIFKNDGEAMKLADKMGRDVVVEHMRNLLKK